jgi:Beta-lactamase class C and other penicillin binding proteins
MSGIDSDAPDPVLEADFDNLGDMRYGSGELMRRLAAHPLAHQPGEGWQYGSSFSVLGRVIELVADRPLDDYLASAVFSPLGMADTGYRVSPGKAGRLAAVHASEGGVLQRLDDEDARAATEGVPLVTGSGGLNSTAPDYLRFTRMLLRRGELDGVRLLRPDTVALMTRNHVAPPLCPIVIWGYVSEGEGYGLGVGVSVTPPAPRMPGPAGTYGWAGSWSTRFWIDPAHDLSASFMVQSQPFAFVGVAEDFWSLVCQALVD